MSTIRFGVEALAQCCCLLAVQQALQSEISQRFQHAKSGLTDRRFRPHQALLYQCANAVQHFFPAKQEGGAALTWALRAHASVAYRLGIPVSSTDRFGGFE
jgi:hypothetical protein